MQEKHYKGILYFIIFIVLVTLGIQIFWNYKNYQAGKQQLINEVQISLDNAVEQYYTSLAEDNLLGISFSDNAKTFTTQQIDSLFVSMDASLGTKHNENHIKLSDSNNFKKISIFSGDKNGKIDTLFKRINIDGKTQNKILKWDFDKDKNPEENPFFELTTKVIFAISNDSLDLHKVDSLVSTELNRKNIAVNYSLWYTTPTDSIVHPSKKIDLKNALYTSSKSSYIPNEDTLTLSFNNATFTVLKRNSISLLISFIFMVGVVSCLLYLLKIIKTQKQLAEIKSDLISNITHEFKTPIATIGAAVEGIISFNPKNNPEKNIKYAKISQEQVSKLNIMVEKLLETATLDSENLQLNFEEVDLVPLLENASKREDFIASNKTISFSAATLHIPYKIDVFHFENAINNIIENAIKYGGNQIKVAITNHKNTIIITIEDNGTTLDETHKKQLFEKFYRVPTGNTHNVKGFGIGLYYTKKIIEKHNGTITLQVKPTTFKIILPND